MPLVSGQILSHYRLVEQIGEGGMGVVWKAEDAKLRRAVAIKVLPEDVSGDPDRLARFDREARALASLHHPNVASIFGFEEADGVRFLVMELVEGEDLSRRLQRGALPQEEALGIARQIAEGLEAAHESGVIHRDLKPANVKITGDGTVKILDFGLAKAWRGEEDGAVSGTAALSQSPTLARTGTAAGLILGTAAYMSPEQARGRPVDRRSDIWSFGVVLYEMLTGAQLHTGETVSDVLASVLKTDADLGALPGETPAGARRLLRRCLERDPRRRLRDIGDARIELDAVLAGEETDPSPAVERTSGRMQLVPWLIAGVALAALLAVLAWLPSREASTGAGSYELSLSPPAGGQWLTGSNSGWGVLSPDGRRVVSRAATRDGTGLWVQDLDGRRGRLLPRTEEGFYPFWSPDGRWVAFFSRGLLQRIEVEGGLPETICVASWGRGGSWSSSGRILLTPLGGGSIHVVSADGGEARPVTQLDTGAGEDAHYWPAWLPDGERFLYFIRSGRRENQGIYLGRVRAEGIDDERRRVVASSSSGILVPEPSGGAQTLLWVEDETLLARKLDPQTAELSGPTSRIADGVRVLESQRAAMVSASAGGTLLWASSRFGSRKLTWYDRSGRRLEVVANVDPSLYQPNLAPNGRWATFVLVKGGQGDIWLLDPETGESRALTSSASYEEGVIWSPDSREIIFRSGSNQTAEFLRLRVDGSDSPQPVLQNSRGFVSNTVNAWLTGGWIVLEAKDAAEDQRARDLLVTRLDGDGEASGLVDGDGDQYSAVVAPAGDALAYLSDESGELEGYVVSLSTNSGRLATGPDRQRLPVHDPRDMHWSLDGGELFVLTPGGNLFAVPIARRDGRVQAGSPRRLFQVPVPGFENSFSGTTADGRFLFVVDPDAQYETLSILLDWRARLESVAGPS